MTLFILREKDEPLQAGDMIIAQGFQRYEIKVHQVLSSKEVNDKVQYKINGTRTVVEESK